MNNKWDSHIAPYLHEIESWAMCGASEKEIAGKLGVSYPTFRRYVKEKPELSSLLNQCKKHVKKVLEKALASQSDKPATMKRQQTPMQTYSRPDGVKRPDQNGIHRGAFEKNKKRIYATQTTCGICGGTVDRSLKYPHPLSPCIDHIIPVSKGGHPSDISNLQLAHWTCNRQKSDKLIDHKEVTGAVEVISNRVLPQSADWKNYKHN